MAARKPETEPPDPPLNVRLEGRSNAGAGPNIWRDWLPVPAAVAIGAAVWIWFALDTRITLEDAYITSRYARNLAEGYGFVYNPGENVLGTTTPLQTLLLAGLGAMFGPSHIPVIARLLMPVFGLAAGALACCAFIRLGVSRVAAVTGLVLFYLNLQVVRTSLGGMETPLALFLMALSLYCLSRKWSVAATAAVAALALCRLDGLTWGGILVGVILLSDFRKPVRQAAVFGAITMPWLLFSVLYFGSAVPNTILAKGVVRPGRERILFDPVHLERYFHWFMGGMGFNGKGVLVALWAGLLCLGAYYLLRKRRAGLLVIPVFPLVFAAVMYFGRAPKYPWYLVPMTFCCMFLGGIGLGEAFLVPRRWSNRTIRLAVPACGIAIIAVVLSGMIRDLPRAARHTKLFQENEVGLRKGIGVWLSRNTPKNATVAMEAIGYQGYFSNRRIIDMAGLITPAVVRFKASTGKNGIVFKRITTELKPDYIVLRSFEVEENHHFNGGLLFETPRDREAFFRTYKEVRRFVAPHPELAPLVTHVTLFGKKSIRPPNGPQAR